MTIVCSAGRPPELSSLLRSDIATKSTVTGPPAVEGAANGPLAGGKRRRNTGAAKEASTSTLAVLPAGEQTTEPCVGAGLAAEPSSLEAGQAAEPSSLEAGQAADVPQLQAGAALPSDTGIVASAAAPPPLATAQATVRGVSARIPRSAVRCLRALRPGAPNRCLIRRQPCGPPFAPSYGIIWTRLATA